MEAGGARARILEPDLLSTNAVIHIIDEVLGLPFMNVLEKLRADPNLRRTYKYVEGSKEMTNSLASGHSNYTLFAPSNQAWSNLRPQDRDLLNASPELLNKVRNNNLCMYVRIGETLTQLDDFSRTAVCRFKIIHVRCHTVIYPAWNGRKICAFDGLKFDTKHF